MPKKANILKIELQELDKLLEKKKVSIEEYLKLKAKLEAGVKEEGEETAKELTKPKILNVICPNCGSPQREAPSGEQFNCESCGKLIKVFDAVREAQRLLEKMPQLMENVALQQLFIEPAKFKIEDALQAGMVSEFILTQLKPVIAQNSARYPANQLNSSFANLLESHGFRFLTVLDDTPVPITYSLFELNHMQEFQRIYFPRVFCTVVPFQAEPQGNNIVLQKYDDENFSLWARDEIEEVIEMLDSGTQKKMRQVIPKVLAEVAAEKKTTVDNLDENMVYSSVRDLALEGFEREQDPYSGDSMVALKNLAYMGWVQKVLKRMNATQKGKQQIIYPWNDAKKLEKRANGCFAAVKPLNELANLLAGLSVYAPHVQLSMFMGFIRDSDGSRETVIIDEILENRFAPLSRDPDVRATEEERKRLGDEEDRNKEEIGDYFGFFPAICWANFYKGLASYAQGYGRMLLLNKECMDKKNTAAKAPAGANEFAKNFEDAAAAFDRAAENSDEKRKPYLQFYAHVCRGISSMFSGNVNTADIKKIREEKASLSSNGAEKKPIGLNLGYVGDKRTGIQQFYIRDGKKWINQRIEGLARTIEGPRYLFFTDTLLFPEG